jgi:hypothetical protein
MTLACGTGPGGVPILGARELVDVADEFARRVEPLLADAPLRADGGRFAVRRRAEQRVSTLVELFGYRQALGRAERARRAADDGLLAASAERHRELERTAHALRGQLELHVAFAVLHEDLSHCAPGDVALAAAIPVAQVGRLVAQERERLRMDPGWRL